MGTHRVSSVTNMGDIWLVIETHSENNFAVSERETDFQVLVLFCTKKRNF